MCLNYLSMKFVSQFLFLGRTGSFPAFFYNYINALDKKSGVSTDFPFNLNLLQWPWTKT